MSAKDATPQRDAAPDTHTSVLAPTMENSPNMTLSKQRERGLSEAVGKTPLVQVPWLSRLTGHTVLAKCEWTNPLGSPKDRIALAMITGAEKEGRITPWAGKGRTTGEPDFIVEGTVGSTGISLAAIANARGYKCTIFMPDDQAKDKYAILAMLGAQVIQCRPCSIADPNHFVNQAKRFADTMNDRAVMGSLPRALFCDQFENEKNFQCHYESTGPEIYQQFMGQRPSSESSQLSQWWPMTWLKSPTPADASLAASASQSRIDALVLGAGTGGTIGGVAAYLKGHFPQLQTILADPQGSSLYWRVKHGVMYHPLQAEGSRKRHQVDTIVEGVGGNRMVGNFARALPYIDDAVSVSDQEVVDAARGLLKHDGFFVGSSSAVNAAAVLKIAPLLPPGSVIVTMFCDPGTRHLTKFWNVEYLTDAGIV